MGSITVPHDQHSLTFLLVILKKFFTSQILQIAYFLRKDMNRYVSFSIEIIVLHKHYWESCGLKVNPICYIHEFYHLQNDSSNLQNYFQLFT